MPEKDPTTWTAATWLLALGMAIRVVREQETGKPMPDEVRARRSAIRVSL